MIKVRCFSIETRMGMALEIIVSDKESGGLKTANAIMPLVANPKKLALAIESTINDLILTISKESSRG